MVVITFDTTALVLCCSTPTRCFCMNCTTADGTLITVDWTQHWASSSLYNHGTNVTTIDNTQLDLDMTWTLYIWMWCGELHWTASTVWLWLASDLGQSWHLLVNSLYFLSRVDDRIEFPSIDKFFIYRCLSSFFFHIEYHRLQTNTKPHHHWLLTLNE